MQVGSRSGLFLLLALGLLPLNHNQNELIIRSNQNLILGSLEPHKLELVMRIQIPDCIACLGDELRDESCKRIAYV